MTGPAFQLAPLRRDAPSDVAALKRIYEEAIPASERKPLAGMIASPACAVVAAHAGGDLVGFTIVFAGRSADLLEYIAVRRDQRGSGLGARLYVAARDEVDAAGRPLLIEVESDREVCPDRDVRLRRKQFYRRLGARQVQGLAYDLPLETGRRPPALDVMIDRWSGGSVSKALLAAWLSEIYVGVYDREPDDPRIARMLGALPDEITIA